MRKRSEKVRKSWGRPAGWLGSVRVPSKHATNAPAEQAQPVMRDCARHKGKSESWLGNSGGVYDEKIEKLGREKYPHTKLLRQVKGGVGPITALAYVLTLENPERFAQSRDVGHLGLVPKQEDSGDRLCM